MRGKSLFILGILLTISNSSGPFRAEQSIAQTAVAAREDGLEQTSENKVIAAKSPHAVRKAVVRARKSSSSSKRSLDASGSSARVRLSPYLPVTNRPDIEEKHKILANEVLGLLPPQCQTRISSFYVRYDKPDRRGLAGKSTIIVDGTIPDDEFRAVLIHEAMGHLFDLGCLTGDVQSRVSAFRDGDEDIYNNDPSVAFYSISWTDVNTMKAGSKDEDFATGYASSDPFEDMAESTTYFLLHRRTFEERAQNNVALATKLKWLETFLPVNTSLSSREDPPWDGDVPWDATKIPYVWKNTSTTLAKQ